MEVLYESLVKLVPPAILITAVAFLVHFFGKAISDQNPFCDDRKWEIEIKGINFLLNQILINAVVGVCLANYFGGFGTGHLIRFVIVSTIGAWFFLVGGALSRKVYNTPFFPIPSIKESMESLAEQLLKVDRVLASWFFSIILFYFLTIEYQTGYSGWLIVMIVMDFWVLTLIAISYSMRTLNLPRVDIYFTNNKEPIRDAILLKINEDNIRIKEKIDEETYQVVILNKSNIDKIEFFPSRPEGVKK